MPDKLNGLRVRMCAVIWVLVDLGYIEAEDADDMTQRIERMEAQEIAEWVLTLTPTPLKES